MEKEAHKLFEMGHEITGSWLHEVTKPEHLTEFEWHHALAIKDVAELSSADCIILDVDGSSTTGGRYVEWGLAIGHYNMLKLVVGADTTGVFNTLADRTFNNWSELLLYLKDYNNGPTV